MLLSEPIAAAALVIGLSAAFLTVLDAWKRRKAG